MKRHIASLITVGMLSSTPALAQDVDIAITNLTNGTFFTPLLIAAHVPTTHLFELGTAASTNLQAMAEGGDISGLSTDLDAVGADKVENPAGGPLAPGMTTTASLTTASGNTHLSLVAMLVPTNDGFVGLDGLMLPSKPGTYTYYLNGYDAGTEANNEVVNGGGTPGVLGVPGDPGGHNGSGGTGVTTTEVNQTVHIHPGVLGDTNPSGGPSDLDSSIHRWLNPVAKLVITIN
jgi:hypothetical protein